jgi:succinate dehydrogenase / fumarate reductase membrane anchor subunit
LRAWLVQRASAVYMLLFIVYFLAHFILHAPNDHIAWRAWITGPGVRIAVAAFFAALLAHAWVGLRVVITDYVHPLPLRAGMLGLIAASGAVIGVWVVRILWFQHG